LADHPTERDEREASEGARRAQASREPRSSPLLAPSTSQQPHPLPATSSTCAPRKALYDREDASVLLGAGFAAGMLVTAVLSPYDRALYLSIAHRRAFLDGLNWKRPFQGLGQGVIGRAISSGLWFPLERVCLDSLNSQRASWLSEGVRTTLAGQIAGCLNALLLSPLNMIKFQTWGMPEGERRFHQVAGELYKIGGVSTFFRGLGGELFYYTTHVLA
ncbi:MAG: hypothetical protein SGPRY_005967, partial [Prymnesium sp.]